MAVYSLNQIIEMMTVWEKDLLKFYKILKGRLTDEMAIQVAALLYTGQSKMVKVLSQVGQHNPEKLEFNKNLPEYKNRNIVHGINLNDPITADKLLEKLFDYEEELLKIYQHLRAKVSFEHSKELLDMLLQIKMGQVKKIKECMDSFV